MHKVLGLTYELGYIPASISLGSSAYWLTNRQLRSGNPTPSGYDLLLVPQESVSSRTLDASVIVATSLLLQLFGQRSLAVNILGANSKEDPIYSQMLKYMYNNSKLEESLPEGQRNFFGLHY